MKKIIHLIAFACLLCAMSLAFVWNRPTSAAPQAPTDLAVGDIAVFGYQADNPDQIRLVLLAPICTGTTFYVTDNGWKADNTFRTNEGNFTYTAVADLPAGTILDFSSFTAPALGNDADQIFIYQSSAPTIPQTLRLNSFMGCNMETKILVQIQIRPRVPLSPLRSHLVLPPLISATLTIASMVA